MIIRHGLILLWFTDLMNVTEEVTIHRPNVSNKSIKKRFSFAKQNIQLYESTHA